MKAVNECSSTRLFNGVKHIWSEEINGMSESKSKTGLDTEANSDLNLVMAQNEAMTGIAVSAEGVDTGSDDGGDENVELNQPYKYNTKNPWIDCAKKMVDKNYLEVREMSTARTDRKRSVAKFIVGKVRQLKAEDATVIGAEKDDVLESEWTNLVHSLDPGYYGKI